jgi:hypothetical protein
MGKKQQQQQQQQQSLKVGESITASICVIIEPHSLSSSH